VIDPFKIDGPTVIKLSGGRTSGKMLHSILESNNGLPADAIVCFNNTGKEEEASLVFVRDIGLNWNVPIVWLEYRSGGEFAVVDFETANRDGAPFDAIIADRMAGGTSGLPNRVARYCSSELKTRATIHYLRSIGWTEWDCMLGVRADEPIRVATFRANPNPETPSETVRIPLADAGVGAHHVGWFWAAQPFDLGLPNHGGKTMHGNCDLCFLKPAAQVQSLIAEKPERAVWWVAKEAAAEKITTGTGSRFRSDRPSYSRMAKFAADQVTIFDPDEVGISCFCGD
jgi:3'-phosphoadenosine 5'-phosphosulfate sulfotransferase (PAPS reductase)/FAD synthetase